MELLKVPVHCFVCLNTDRGKVAATTAVDGYVVCDEHALVENLSLNADNTVSLTGTITLARRKAGLAPVKGNMT